jgi:hypothetical protein
VSKIVSDLVYGDFCSSHVDWNCFAWLDRRIFPEDVVERVPEVDRTEFGADEYAEFGNGSRTSLFGCIEEGIVELSVE